MTVAQLARPKAYPCGQLKYVRVCVVTPSWRGHGATTTEYGEGAYRRPGDVKLGAGARRVRTGTRMGQDLAFGQHSGKARRRD